MLLWRLWKSLKALLLAGGAFAQAFSIHALPHLKEYVRSANVYDDPQRRISAAKKHRELVGERTDIRTLRLSRATQRWSDDVDFETRFSQERREQARRVREENKK